MPKLIGRYPNLTKCRNPLNKETIVTIQYLHSYKQKSIQIGCADGIFAFRLMFSYGQRSKCADLLNSYKPSIKIFCGTAHNIMFML